MSALRATFSSAYWHESPAPWLKPGACPHPFDTPDSGAGLQGRGDSSNLFGLPYRSGSRPPHHVRDVTRYRPGVSTPDAVGSRFTSRTGVPYADKQSPTDRRRRFRPRTEVRGPRAGDLMAPEIDDDSRAAYLLTANV